LDVDIKRSGWILTTSRLYHQLALIRPIRSKHIATTNSKAHGIVFSTSCIPALALVGLLRLVDPARTSSQHQPRSALPQARMGAWGLVSTPIKHFGHSPINRLIHLAAGLFSE